MHNNIYEEVEIEDMMFDPVEDAYSYRCPCGDVFILRVAEMKMGEDIAICASCPLRIRVIY